MNDALIRELKDDLQQQRAQLWWKRYGTWIIALSIAVVIGSAANVAWQSMRQAAQEKDTAALIAALAATGSEQAAQLDALAKGAVSGTQRAIATLTLANQQRDRGNMKEALEAYVRVASDGDVPRELANLALSAALRVAADAKLEHVALARAPTADEPFYAMAQEARGWYALAMNRPADAVHVFEALLASGQAVPVQRARMEAALSTLRPRVSP